MNASRLSMQTYTGPVMIALQYNDLFDLDSIPTSTNTDALPEGRAFTFIKVGQAKLLDVLHGQFQRKFMLDYYDLKVLDVNVGCANSE